MNATKILWGQVLLVSATALAFFWWWFAYDAYARDIFVEGAYIAAAGGIAAVVVAVTISVWRAREAKRVTTYGSARWADAREVREAGLLGHDGVLLSIGRFDRRGNWRRRRASCRN